MWSPALYLSVKQIMDKSVDLAKNLLGWPSFDVRIINHLIKVWNIGRESIIMYAETRLD